MFESLSDRIKEDTAKDENPKEKMMRWLLIAAVSLVIFGGLFVGGRMIGG